MDYNMPTPSEWTERARCHRGHEWQTIVRWTGHWHTISEWRGKRIMLTPNCPEPDCGALWLTLPDWRSGPWTWERSALYDS